MLPIWRDNWLFLLLDEKNSRERDVPERLLVEPSIYAVCSFCCTGLETIYCLARPWITSQKLLVSYCNERVSMLILRYAKYDA